MADKTYEENVQNATDRVRKTANETADSMREYANRAADTAQDYAGRAYDSAQEYADSGMKMAGRMSENLRDFVRNDPWIAIMSAFAVGYLLARVMRRVSA